MQHNFRNLRIALGALLLLTTVSTFGQSRPTWGTAREIQSGVRGNLAGTITAIDAARNTITLRADGDVSGSGVRVNLDAMTARYQGFGAGSATISGSAGFRQLRIDDRVQVSGVGRPNQVVDGDYVTLLGRSVSPAATPTPTVSATPAPNTVEGVVRSINPRESRLVLETDRREMHTVYGAANTPVYYQGQLYAIANIEVGDRIRVQFESRTSDGVRARIIDVLVDGTSDSQTPNTLTSVTGRVTRVDSRAQQVRIDTGRPPEVRIDAAGARDAQGRTFRVTDLQIGDRIEASGRFTAADVFRADAVRFAGEGGQWDRTEDVFGAPTTADPRDVRPFETVVIYGTVEQPFQDGGTLTVREPSPTRDHQVLAIADFAVRLTNGAYTTVDQLKRGDRIVVQAFRDASGRLIAQTIRTR